MGKRLIIKGADFSKNGIPYSLTWYSNNIDKSTDITVVYADDENKYTWNDNIFPGYCLYNQYKGKPVNIIRTRIPNSFKLYKYATKLKYSILYAEAASAGSEVSVLRKLKDFTLSEDDLKNNIITIQLHETIKLSDSNLSGIFIGVNLQDVPAELTSIRDLRIPCCRLSNENLYYIDYNKVFTKFNAGLSMDYGYEQ